MGRSGKSPYLRSRSLLTPYTLLYLYRNRLRVHATQELLAGIGVAVAVALVFATLVASGSISGSATQVVHAVVGPANLQLRARGSEGFDESLLWRVEHLPGVEQAGPLLEQTATLAASGRRVTVYLAGTDISLATLDGLAHTLPFEVLSARGIALSDASAKALGLAPPRAGARAPQVTLLLRGRADPVSVTTLLGHETAGALSSSLVAIMSLRHLQELAGLPGRVTRIYIQTAPGSVGAVRAELAPLAGRRLTVTGASQDLALLHQALGPSNQASVLFATISALLGFLFAFNAMLLTVPERRQTIADLRVDGARPAAIVQMVIFQALCLGVVASAAGLLIGYFLSTGLFHQTPGYLSQVFTLGTGTVIGLQPLLLALAGGLLATCLASAVPLIDLRSGRPLAGAYTEEAAPGNQLSERTRRALAAAALALLAASSALFALVPSAALIACVLLALATILAVPVALAAVLHTAGVLAERYPRLTSLPVALTSLRATTLRSLALAATGALALFGSMALGGARNDLLRGVGTVARQFSADADVWVISPHDNQATVPFSAGRYAQRLASLPQVASVSSYAGAFLDWGARRPWVIARPIDSSAEILHGQTISGRPSLASARLDEGGWIVLSKQIADEHHVGVGGSVSLPTPTGSARMRIAATSTNFGWPTGVVFMNTADFDRLWGSRAPTALGVDLRPGADATSAQPAIERALGAATGLEVISARTRAARIESSAGEGLGQLGEIASLLLAATVIAMVAALGSSIWQQRSTLAALRIEGAPPARLRRVLLVEALLLLSAGCVTGALAGVYGQVIIDGYLKHVAGFPVASLIATARPLEIFAAVILTVLAIAAVPGWLASRVPPMLAFDDE